MYALSYNHRVSVQSNMSGFKEPLKEAEIFLRSIHFIKNHRYSVSIKKNGILHLKDAGIYQEDQKQYNRPNRSFIKKLIDSTPREILAQEILKLQGPDLIYAGEYLGREYKKNIPIHNQIVQQLSFYNASEFGHSFDQHENIRRMEAFLKNPQSIDQKESLLNNVIKVDFKKKKRVA